MRVIAYYGPDEDPAAVRAAILKQSPQPHQVAMRAGWLWHVEPCIENGFDMVHAPRYPGILRDYAEHGTPATPFRADPSILAPPDEITQLPQVPEISIFACGVHLHTELDKMPARGLKIAINEAIDVTDADWILANDGFAIMRYQPRRPVVRACRLRHANTVPGGPWFRLDRLGITDGLYSVLCALRLAGGMGAKVVWLYGNDLVPGNGIDGRTGNWTAHRLSGLKRQTMTEIKALALKGTEVRWVRWEDHHITINGKPLAECQTTPE
jgi:hypothetical protein